MALFEVVGSYAFFDIHNTEFPPLAAAANVRLATNRPQSHWLSFFVQSPSVTNSLFPMTPAPKSVPHLPRPDRLVEYPTHFSNVSFTGGKE